LKRNSWPDWIEILNRREGTKIWFMSTEEKSWLCSKCLSHDYMWDESFQNRNMNLGFYCFVFIFKRTLVSTFIFSVRNMFNQELEQNVDLKYFSWSTCSSSQAQALSISWGKENFSLMTKKILWRASRVSREFFKANTSIQPIRKKNFEWFFS